MRFMMLVKADKNYEAGAPPSPELMAAIGKLTEEGTRAGVVLETGGLLPSSKGARLVPISALSVVRTRSAARTGSAGPASLR